VFEVVSNDEPETIDAEELGSKPAVAAPWKQLPDMSSPGDLDGDAQPAERVERSEPPVEQAPAAKSAPKAPAATDDDLGGM
jgi:hypothetical protein